MATETDTSARREHTLKTAHGSIEIVIFNNRVQCNRYTGKFITTKLQAKAETGLWYTRIIGNPHAPEGEGTTPTMAVLDCLRRVNHLQRHMASAEAALLVASTL